MVGWERRGEEGATEQRARERGNKEGACQQRNEKGTRGRCIESELNIHVWMTETWCSVATPWEIDSRLACQQSIQTVIPITKVSNCYNNYAIAITLSLSVLNHTLLHPLTQIECGFCSEEVSQYCRSVQQRYDDEAIWLVGWRQYGVGVRDRAHDDDESGVCSRTNMVMRYALCWDEWMVWKRRGSYRERKVH